MTLEELVAACEGIVDVSIDKSSHELDRVLERLRSLDDQQRARLSNALAIGIDRMHEALREVTARITAIDATIASWRERRDAADAALAASADERIANLVLDRDAMQAEAAELRAGHETFRYAVGLVHDAARRSLPGK